MPESPDAHLTPAERAAAYDAYSREMWPDTSRASDERVVTEADVNLLLAEAAMLRSSYLGGDATVIEGDESTTEMYRYADRFDDLAALLAPMCVPPLSEFEQQCADCEDGWKYNAVCPSCRGTRLWPPTKGGVRLRLLETP